jgi:hypothetical protein
VTITLLINVVDKIQHTYLLAIVVIHKLLQLTHLLTLCIVMEGVTFFILGCRLGNAAVFRSPRKELEVLASNHSSYFRSELFPQLWVWDKSW